jgi:hypothetical protein
MKIGNPPGAQFEILVDGKPRSYRDIKAVAIASAEFLRSRNLRSEVAVKDLQTGEVTVVAKAWAAYQDNVDYNVFSGEWLIGRIYERNGFPDAVRFFWSLHGVVLARPPGIHTDGHAPTLDDAKANFQKSWGAWKAWAKLEEG